MLRSLEPFREETPNPVFRLISRKTTRQGEANLFRSAKAFWVFILLQTTFFYCGILCAQESRGSISGSIADVTAAAIPGATITMVEVHSGTTSKTVSNHEGRYRIPFLATGDYSLTVEASGFEKLVHQNISLSAGEQRSLDLVLHPGSVSATITVTAAAPQISMTDTSVGQVVTTDEVADLPLNGRTPMQLALLSAGVISTIQPGQLLPFANGTAASLAIGGIASNSSELLLDGAPDNIWTGVLAYSPPQDSVQQVTVRVFDADASYGHTMSGVINQVLKSGGNLFHGTAYEYSQVSALDANSFFNNRTGTPIVVTHYNQYGASVNGPVVLPRLYNGRNKLFFLFAWEALNLKKPATSYSTVPTDAERGGDFSALLPVGCPNGYQNGNTAICANGKANAYQLYNPYKATQSGSTITRQPLTNNSITASGIQLNPIALAYLKFFPAPNTAPSAPTGYQNYISNPPQISDYDNEVARVDYNFSDRGHIFADFRHNFMTQTSSNSFNNPATGSVLSRRNMGSTLDMVYAFSPTTAMEVRGNWTYFYQPQGGNSAGFDPTTLGFPAYMTQNSRHLQMPTIAMSGSGFGTLANSAITGSNAVQGSDLYQIFADLVKTMGRHSLKVGVDMRKQINSLSTYGNSAGSFSFGSNWLQQSSSSSAPSFGYDLASFLMGLPTSGSYDLNAHPAYHTYYYAGFIQDNWSVTRNFAVNLGLRYDRDLPLIEKMGHVVSGFDSTSDNPIASAAIAAYNAHPISQIPVGSFQVKGGLTFPSPSDGAAYAAKSNNFSPRIGFAYTPSMFNDKLVIRGGFAMFVSSIYNQSSQYTSGFSQTTQYVATNDNYLTPATTLSNPFPNGITQPTGSSLGLATFLGQGLNFFHSPQKNPYAIRWNLGIQHQIMKDTMFEIDYIGNHALKLPVGVNRDALPNKYLSTLPVRDQATINALSAVVTNPFAGLIPGTSLNGSTIATQSLLTPFPEFTSVSEQLTPIGHAYYHALQARIERRMAQGLYLVGTYGWSKAMARSSFLNAGDPAPSKFISSTDATHHFVAAMTYHLPIGRGTLIDLKSKWIDTTLGGWTLNAIYSYQTGFPISWGDMVTTGIPITVNPREVTPGVSAISKASFDLVAADQYASHLRIFPLMFSNLRADGINNLDSSILKNFRFHKNIDFQLRLETFNTLNRPAFGGPNTSATSASFGLITSQANTPRQVQLAGKIIF